MFLPEFKNATKDEIKTAWNSGAVYGGSAPSLVLYLQGYRFARQMGKTPADSVIHANLALDLKRQFFPRRVSKFGETLNPRGNGLRFYDKAELAQIGFRLVSLIRAEAGNRYNGLTQTDCETGYYQDSFGDSSRIICGAVFQVSARKGFARLYAGVFENESELFGIDFSKQYQIKNSGDNWNQDLTEYSEFREIAFRADQLAENNAEKNREYDSAWQAGSQFAMAGAEIAELRREGLEILAERREAIAQAEKTQFAHLCQTMRRRVSEIREEIQQKRDYRAELKSGSATDFWFSDSREMLSAFNDGAGVQESAMAGIGL